MGRCSCRPWGDVNVVARPPRGVNLRRVRVGLRRVEVETRLAGRVTRASPRERLRAPAEVRKNSRHRRGVDEGGENAQVRGTFWAFQRVKAEGALHEHRPLDARRHREEVTVQDAVPMLSREGGGVVESDGSGMRER